MKILKKMLLIKWYYIEHQLINFDSLNFMTGKNGSGKSTIIDALQIVMLGDTRGNFFNKAANDKSGRTLDGYLKGEISNDEDVGFKSKRNGRFTSYIALEFYDTVDRKSFTCGIVFDSYKDAPTDHMFFILNDAIPENHFIDEESKTAMDYKKLKIYFSKNYPANKAKTYKESNKSYQQDFLAKMGAIKPKFFNLFKKSVTFTPIDDIEKFISEYVCDVTNEIDIESMKQNIRQYKELEKQALLMQERMHELKKIEQLFFKYKDQVEEELLQNYLMQQSSLQIDINKFNIAKKEYVDNLQKIEDIENEEKKIEKNLAELLELKDRKRDEKNSSDIGKKQIELNRAIEESKQKLKSIEESTEKVIRNIKNKISSWKVNINQLLDCRNKIENENLVEIAKILKDNIEYLMQMNNSNIETLDCNALLETKDSMEKMNGFSNEIYFERNQKELMFKSRKETLELEIKNLKTGIKPYKKSLLEFREKLRNELENTFNESVEVHILADLLEIKNMKWKDAIELYVNHQMFYLIINPKYYEEASRIYRKLSKDNMYFGIGIVDIKAIQNLNVEVKENSLANELETENEFAKTYINYLLGKVIECEDVEDLRNYKTAITPDCMLYKNYVLRKIADKNGEFNFIGKKSIDEQIALKQIELEDINLKINEILEVKDIFKNLKDAKPFSEIEIDYIASEIETIKNKEDIEKFKISLENELNSLDLSWISKISDEIKSLEIKISELNNSKNKKYGERVNLNALTNILKNEKLPGFEYQIDEKCKQIKKNFEEDWINKIGKLKFDEACKMLKLEQINKKAIVSLESARDLINKRKADLVKERSEYNKKYDFSHDINQDDNNEFAEELEKLDKIELPKYINKIQDSKEKAYQQFREDFISKLKANIDEVENQIDELNSALKNSQFGVDKYHFTVKPKQEYRRFYDMITDKMLMEGYNLWSEAFNSKYSEEIKELFEKLTSSDIYDETYQKNISIYTDYKTYLSFDLIVTDKSGDVQKLSRTLDKKSGGETQTPFYISVLASFAQLYRINKNRNDNTLRLIVFDEAFNKMDEERMKESLALLGKFGFQAIIAAPSEKAGELIPLVPNTICVIRKDKNTIVREWERDKSFLD